MKLFDNKTQEDICKEIEEYLGSKKGFPVPSLEGFCMKHNYSLGELKDFSLSKRELKYTIEKIRTQAIVTLEYFLLIDLSNIEFEDKDKEKKKFKLCKKGIMFQLNKLKKE